MLKKFFAVTIALFSALLLLVIPPAYAGDADAGKTVFAANCAACHMGGRNAVNPQKTLQKDDLVQYGMYDATAIITQVTNGKGAMPAFSTKLDATQIENVAAYVLSKADDGWAK
ncbi:MAG: c-type cytochrome [Alkalinema sp. RU_4_3]|nr:c-type cytochrome [Alkalinema sp. RU_4_3]